MKTLLTLSLLAALASVALPVNPAQAADKVLRHVVLFKFKDTSKPADTQKIIDEFAKLPGKIDGILDFEWGTDVGVENLSEGLTRLLPGHIQRRKGRDAYLPHPAHEEFKKIAIPHIDKVVVVDYWTRK